ncbi:GDSL-like lipase/acylhydrolase family protein [Curtobacterium sp. PhB191]|uniref:SGNH/GDSL hydrolase family protein n=1 Tax=Curtobacterium sp. PhB191 TaxID=2485202 RepID=UPI0010DC9D6A|nr:SGNH/GDSL hydrolase family protein [Curtobacterium sp. PhB191]TCU85924.1 GDSL-like lipase/acylhydrolase family protein [Curtobacterium sp. PhB191]
MRVVRALLVVVIVIAAFAVSARALDGPQPQAVGTAVSAPVRLAVVGDSLSAGASRYLGNGLDDGTWITSAVGDDIEFVGGWARSGATPDQMARHVQPVPDVDVLVILAGTNAVRLHRTLAEEADAYRDVVRSIRPHSVIIAALPPYDWQPDAAAAYNRALRELAVSEGWLWGDPWKFARDGSTWVDGVSADGTHPAGPDQYRRLGDAMRELILRAHDDEAITLAAE